MKKIRLIYCSGYHSLVNIISILKILDDNNKYQNILLFINNHLDENSIVKYIDIIDNDIFKFDEILYISKDDLVNKNFDIIYQIKEKYPVVEEYWDDSHFFIEHITLLKLEDVINYKKIVFYDEGLATYIILYIENNYKKIDKVFLLRPELINYQDSKYNIYEINKKIYTNTIYSISKKLNIPIINNSKNSILFLSTLFWDKTIVSINIEEEIKLINKLIYDYGYIVYYKSHPRAQSSDILKIKDNINHDNFKLLDFNYDIESLLVFNKFRFILSYASTSLLMSFKYFNIPAFTYNSRFVEDNNNNKRMVDIKRMINLITPNINDYFNRNLSAEEYYKNFQNTLQKKLEFVSIFKEVENYRMFDDIKLLTSKYETLFNEHKSLLNEHNLSKSKIIELDNNISEIKNILQKPNFILKIIVNLCLAFVPIKKIRDKIRKKSLKPRKIL